ncbi:hybrid sensor histidine kinase/response regulator [Spirosoma harenae]
MQQSPGLKGYCLIVCLVGLWYGTGLFANAQLRVLPQPDRITDRQGLPQAYVPDIMQDQQGFIWAATRDGLCRFDGQRFKVFQPHSDGTPSLSYTGISQLKPGQKGRIWIVSERNDIDIFNPRTETFVNFSRLPAYKRHMAGTFATSVCIDQKDQLWVVASNQSDVFRFDPDGRQSVKYSFKATGAGSNPPNAIFDMVVTPDGQLWLATNLGLFVADERTHVLKPYQPASPRPISQPSPAVMVPIYKLFVRPDRNGSDGGELLLFSAHQVTRFQPRTGITRSYPLPVSVSKPDWVQANCTADSHGNVYFVYAQTLMRFANQAGVEQLVSYQNESPQSQGTRLWVDQSDVLWEGTKGAGIRKYDLKAMPFQTAVYRQSFHQDLLTKPWLAIPANQGPVMPPPQWPTSYDFRYTTDGQGKLWYNTGTSLIAQIDLQTKQITSRPLPVTFHNLEFGHPPCPLATDPTGQVWALRDSLLWQYDPLRAKWQRWPHPISRRMTKTWVVLFTVDATAFWLATEQNGLWRMDKKTGRLHQYANHPNDTTSLSNNAIFSFSSDPEDPNRLWIGTFGGGLCAFDKRTGKCRRITVADGLPNNVIYSVIPDQSGYLWMGTNKGLCRMNRKTGQIITFTREDGLLADEFNRFHYLYLPGHQSDGRSADRILMGGLEGITAFYPNQLSQDTYQPAVELTAMQVNNQPFIPAHQLPIQAVQELSFPYNQNYLTVDFAVMQFNQPTRNRYRYRLEGLDDRWTETSRPQAIYTSLPPGHYKLWVNASNTSGRWSRHVRQLALIIRPPFWATWWAYLLYGLSLIGLVIVLVRAYANRIRLRQSLALQQREMALSQQEADQLRQLNQMKSNFFANITHEFRTPLTLILGPTEQMASEDLGSRNQRRLSTIEQNAHQLLRLINQLLDLSKLEANVMPVHASPGALTDSVAYWLQPFIEQATQQGLTLRFTSEVTGSYYFDAEKLERIVNNLTANALKFTPSGSINISMTRLTEGVRLTVADTGTGIPAEQLPHIFDRFYQVAQPTSQATRLGKQKALHVGTGIGLALVKELVSVQGGTMSVHSRLDEGTTFVVELPYQQVTNAPSVPGDGTLMTINDQQENADRTRVVADGHSSVILATLAHATANEGAWDSLEDSSPRILIVEDNDELAHFIASSLPPTYRTRRAVDGLDGLEQALEHQPDLIISDVLMPRMDGFTLCSRLKTDLRTSHIPLILLTAKASRENRLEGLSLGADDYLTKPFNVQELQLRVRNQLDSQQRQRDWVRASLTQPDPVATSSATASPDPFLSQLYALIEAHLDDTTLSVDMMITELGLSRTSLVRKVRSLTDMSPNELIRNYRLKQAAQLLRQGQPITQTAYQVGFDSPAYFSKCFRDLYQLTPREFVAQV